MEGRESERQPGVPGPTLFLTIVLGISSVISEKDLTDTPHVVTCWVGVDVMDPRTNGFAIWSSRDLSRRSGAPP